MNAASSFYPASRLSDRLAALGTHEAKALRFTAVSNSRAVLLSVGGDIDAANIATWEAALNEVGATVKAPALLLIDVRAADLTGIAAVAALGAQSIDCRQRGIELRLIGSEAGVTRTIAAGGWSDELPVFGSVHAALKVRPQDGGRNRTNERSRSARTRRSQRAALR